MDGEELGDELVPESRGRKKGKKKMDAVEVFAEKMAKVPKGAIRFTQQDVRVKTWWGWELGSYPHEVPVSVRGGLPRWADDFEVVVGGGEAILLGIVRSGGGQVAEFKLGSWQAPTLVEAVSR